MMEFEILTTPRLQLRKITPEVLKYVFESSADAQLMEFLGLISEEELQKERAKYEKGFTTFNKSFVNFHLIEPQSGTLIGMCGFHTWYTDHRRAEIGYNLLYEGFKNKGYMTEAMEAIIRYGFETMNLNRIEAFIGTANVPSLKLLEKFGFTREGLLREHYAKNGRIEDSIVYSLLKGEYGADPNPNKKHSQMWGDE